MNLIRFEQSVANDLSYTIANRSLFGEVDVFAINIMGGAGSGKTSLIKAGVERLILDWRIGVITADPGGGRDAEHLRPCAECVAHIDTGLEGVLRPEQVHATLERFDLSRLDLVLIENVSSLIGPERFDLGQGANVVVFSVAAGHDKAAKYPAIVRMANLVVLNKIDLLDVMSFDLAAFRRDIHQLNPGAALLEISTLRRDGLEAWFDWLRAFRGSVAGAT